ncbi:MAG: sigma 54-interacting transcriptional regulator, partial [Myxococcota bacterium]
MEVTERRGPSEQGPPRLALLFEGPAQPFVVPLLRGQSLTVGRRPPADVVVDDTSLSRQHARFTWEEDGVWLEDLDSTNGSMVNQKRVTRALLVPGDTASLGAVPVRIHALHTPPSTEPIQTSDAFEEGLRTRIDERPGESLVVALIADSAGRPLDTWAPSLRAALLGNEALGFYASGGLAVAGVNRDDLEGRLAIAVRRDELRVGLAEYPADAESADELLVRVHRLVQLASAGEPLLTARHYPHDRSASQVVASDNMRTVYAQVDRVASTRAPVLLVGETGVGKELVARAIHQQSDRRTGPMKALNCGAIPGTLQESVLFGHERGAFTGADKRMPGIFEQADGGTVFLDEIGELPADTQAALL